MQKLYKTIRYFVLRNRKTAISINEFAKLLLFFFITAISFANEPAHETPNNRQKYGLLVVHNTDKIHIVNSLTVVDGCKTVFLNGFSFVKNSPPPLQSNSKNSLKRIKNTLKQSFKRSKAVKKTKQNYNTTSCKNVPNIKHLFDGVVFTLTTGTNTAGNAKKIDKTVSTHPFYLFISQLTYAHFTSKGQALFTHPTLSIFNTYFKILRTRPPTGNS